MLNRVSKFKKPDPPRKKRWTEGEKMRAVLLLQENKFDKQLTAETIGISVATLDKWVRDLGAKVETAYVKVDDIVRVEATDSICTDLNIRHKAFVHELFTTKNIALSELRKRILQENNLSRLTEALRLLHEMSVPIMEGEEVASKKTMSDFLEKVRSEYKE